MPKAVTHSLADLWTERIGASRRDRDKFDKMRELVYVLYADDSYARVFSELGIDVENLKFKIGFNKVVEFVDIYRGSLYHQNPVRQVLGRHEARHDPASVTMTPQGQPMLGARAQRDQGVAWLLGKPLNFTPVQHNLTLHSEDAIDQALLAGRGCLWTEFDPWTGLPGSYFDDVKTLLIDPDATSMEIGNAWWIGRERRMPLWWVQDAFDLPEGDITANGETIDSYLQGQRNVHETRRAHEGDTVVYYEIFTCDGLGGRSKGSPKALADVENIYHRSGAVSDYAYLVIAPGACAYPLNVPPTITGGEMAEATAWPIPFYKDGQWPVTTLDFKRIAGTPYPLSPIQPALGELMLYQYVLTHIANKIPTTMRDWIALAKQLDDKVKEQFAHGASLNVVELTSDQMASLETLVAFLQHPEMQRTPFEIVQMLEAQIDDRLGLTELMRGGGVQHRTQEETMVKTRFARIRPDAMANKVDAWQSMAARKEALVLRAMTSAFEGTDEYGRPILSTLGRLLGGQREAELWEQYVRTDWDTAALELEYSIESGSARRPDKERDGDNAQMLGNILASFAQQRSMSLGDNRLHNALMREMGRAWDIGHADEFMLPEGETPWGQEAATPVGGQLGPAGGNRALPGTRQPGLQHRTAGNVKGNRTGRPK